MKGTNLWKGHELTLEWWRKANFVRDIHDLKLKSVFAEDLLQVADSKCDNTANCIASKTNNREIK